MQASFTPLESLAGGALIGLSAADMLIVHGCDCSPAPAPVGRFLCGRADGNCVTDLRSRRVAGISGMLSGAIMNNEIW